MNDVSELESMRKRIQHMLSLSDEMRAAAVEEGDTALAGVAIQLSDIYRDRLASLSGDVVIVRREDS